MVSCRPRSSDLTSLGRQSAHRGSGSTGCRRGGRGASAPVEGRARRSSKHAGGAAHGFGGGCLPQGHQGLRRAHPGSRGWPDLRGHWVSVRSEGSPRHGGKAQQRGRLRSPVAQVLPLACLPASSVALSTRKVPVDVDQVTLGGRDTGSGGLDASDAETCPLRCRESLHGLAQGAAASWGTAGDAVIRPTRHSPKLPRHRSTPLPLRAALPTRRTVHRRLTAQEA